MVDIDLSICQICKEPIWNFICTDCVSEDVKAWLPQNFSVQFIKFHNTFSFHFSTKLFLTGFERCVNCNSEKEFTICAYCYTNEVFHWLRRKDRNLAKRFAEVFAFDFEDSGRKEFVESSEIRPITTIENPKLDFGICDECGEYSEELISFDGEMVCKECASGD